MKYELSVNLYYSIIGPNTELHGTKLGDLKMTTDRAHKDKHNVFKFLTSQQQFC